MSLCSHELVFETFPSRGISLFTLTSRQTWCFGSHGQFTWRDNGVFWLNGGRDRKFSASNQRKNIEMQIFHKILYLLSPQSGVSWDKMSSFSVNGCKWQLCFVEIIEISLSFCPRQLIVNFTPFTDAALPSALFSGAGAANYSLRNPERVALGPWGRVGEGCGPHKCSWGWNPATAPRPAPWPAECAFKEDSQTVGVSPGIVVLRHHVACLLTRPPSAPDDLL